MSSFISVYTAIAAKKKRFFITFFVVTVVTYSVLYALDFYPEPITEDSSVVTTPITTPEPVVVTPEPLPEPEPETVSAALANPVRISIPDSGTDVVILNPDSLDMTDLDNALLDGVARHPQSANFADIGNILLFGHSSYLPTVFNKNFQAFNGVQNLEWGAPVYLYDAAGGVYTYRVTRVYTVKASDTIIDNTRGEGLLTIVTCNSFGSKDDRYIVEATLVEEADAV